MLIIATIMKVEDILLKARGWHKGCRCGAHESLHNRPARIRLFHRQSPTQDARNVTRHPQPEQPKQHEKTSRTPFSPYRIVCHDRLSMLWHSQRRVCIMMTLTISAAYDQSCCQDLSSLVLWERVHCDTLTSVVRAHICRT